MKTIIPMKKITAMIMTIMISTDPNLKTMLETMLDEGAGTY